MIAALSVIVFAQIEPVPPPVPQLWVDCRGTTYASDRLVCGDTELRELDARAARGWAARPIAGRWIEPQEAWFKRSRLCAMQDAHRTCLIAAYRERLALIEADPQGPVVPGMRCRDGSSLNRTTGGFAWRGAGGPLLGLVSVPARVWQPFLKLRKSGRTTMIVDLQGSMITRCE